MQKKLAWVEKKNYAKDLQETEVLEDSYKKQ